MCVWMYIKQYILFKVALTAPTTMGYNHIGRKVLPLQSEVSLYNSNFALYDHGNQSCNSLYDAQAM